MPAERPGQGVLLQQADVSGVGVFRQLGRRVKRARLSLAGRPLQLGGRACRRRLAPNGSGVARLVDSTSGVVGHCTPRHESRTAQYLELEITGVRTSDSPRPLPPP